MENLRNKTLDEVIKEIPELEGFITKALNKETIPNTEIPLRKLLKECNFEIQEIKKFNLHTDEHADKLIFICKKIA